jgi:hypothetical protein
MAYLGTVLIDQKQYSERWIEGLGVQSYCLGTRKVEREQYACDHCGYVATVIGKASEPFFCNCQRLISIAPRGWAVAETSV